MGCLLLAFGCGAQAQNFKTHAVKRGETLESVARLYQVTTADLLKYNRELQPGASLRPNTILVIPMPETRLYSPQPADSLKQDTTQVQQPLGFQTHRVRKKETLFSISRRYEIPEELIKRYNPELYSRTLQRGMVLRIPRFPQGYEPEAEAESTELMSYEVQPKETRWSIAHKFNITLDSLEKLNPELPTNTSYLAAGQELKLPKPPGTDVEQKDTQLYVSYTVPPKKTLFSLSQEYGIPREEIIRLNPEILERGNLQEGMVLRLPEKKADTLQQDGKFVYYEVRPKQTEYSLIRKLGLGYGELLDLNPQMARGLQAGMVLKVPRDKAENLEVKNDLILETFDLKDSINTQHIPKLLVMLPFRLDRLDLSDAAGTQKRIAQNNALQYSLGLYSGFLVALDSISDLGVSVEVRSLDTQLNTSRVKALIGQEDLSGYSAIIGPLAPESVREVAIRASELQVPVIAPLPVGGEFQQENLFFSYTPEERLRDHMLRYMKGQVSDQKILIISDQENKDAEAKILEAFPGSDLVELRQEEENVSLDREQFISQLSQEADNWVFVETDDFKIASSVSSILNSANSDTTRIRMFTTHKNRAFENEVISIPHLSNLKFTFPSVTREATSDAFIRRYRRRFGGDPDRYAIRGFDLGMDLLLRLAYRLDLFQVADQIGEQTYSGNKFNYWKGWNSGYFNTAAYILMYEDLQIKEIEGP